jgi:hypothetical protein
MDANAIKQLQKKVEVMGAGAKRLAEMITELSRDPYVSQALSKQVRDAKQGAEMSFDALKKIYGGLQHAETLRTKE